MLTALAALVASVAPQPALTLKPCTLMRKVPARCGTLAVPEDRTAPGGAKIRIFVGVVPALAKKRAEPIFWLAGGPGGAAAQEDAKFAATVFAAAPDRDLVLVDQRGVGKSAPLLCPAQPRSLSPEDAVAYAKACVAAVRRDPRLYTTDAAMDDVDAVRAALGYRKILLYGGSYGATAAQVYIARHGAHVKAAVLDGGTLLDVPIFERMPRTVQDAFDQTAARCAQSTACHAAFPDVRADLVTVLDRLRAEPASVPGVDVPFGVADAENTVHGLLMGPEGVAGLPLALHRAAAGDLSTLTGPWASGTAEALSAAPRLMYWAIRCAEGWARTDADGMRAVAADSLFLDAGLLDAAGVATACPLLGAPRPAPDTGVVPKSSVPVLFLVGGMDPQDPLANVAAARARLVRAQTLVVPGAGHGSVQYGCMPLVALRFFATTRVTAADRACAASVQPPPFTLP